MINNYRYNSIYYGKNTTIKDIMISVNMYTPQEMLAKIASRARAKRLSLNLSQLTLSEQSGVSYGVIKKFEKTGRISLESLLKLALSLDALNEFNALFSVKSPEDVLSLDELMMKNARKRGRR